MLRSLLVWPLAVLALFLAAAPVSAAPLWLSVTHTTKRGGAYYLPEVVTTQAEQAMLPTGKPPGQKRKGDPGAAILRTRNLQFVCRGVTYAVPDPFVEDLPWLGADSTVRASIHGRDTVFTMIGDSSEKAYSAHFHFREGRFFQRILDYSAGHAIVIRTNDIITGF